MSENITEINYLRYVHGCLDIEQLINIQKSYDKPIHPYYRLIPCDECAMDIAHYECKICRKKLCEICTYPCVKKNTLYCMEHFIACPICDNNCACENCRIYSAEYICEVCCDNEDIGFSCGCDTKKENICVNCGKKICPITKQRL